MPALLSNQSTSIRCLRREPPFFSPAVSEFLIARSRTLLPSTVNRPMHLLALCFVMSFPLWLAMLQKLNFTNSAYSGSIKTVPFSCALPQSGSLLFGCSGLLLSDYKSANDITFPLPIKEMNNIMHWSSLGLGLLF